MVHLNYWGARARAAPKVYAYDYSTYNNAEFYVLANVEDCKVRQMINYIRALCFRPLFHGLKQTTVKPLDTRHLPNGAYSQPHQILKTVPFRLALGRGLALGRD